MGWLFKTPSDNAVEGTLRALHTQNIVDREYQRFFGWFKVLITAGITTFIISAIEFYWGMSLWEATVTRVSDWAAEQLSRLG
tara:strand:- start:7247 stop:7492 length:246 start_codon:yes stop_codon:yes gene_type:complete